MPSPTYDSVVKALNSFIGDKAEGVLNRGLSRSKLAPDKFGKPELKSIVDALAAAAALYVDDPTNQKALENRLKVLAS